MDNQNPYTDGFPGDLVPKELDRKALLSNFLQDGTAWNDLSEQVMAVTRDNQKSQKYLSQLREFMILDDSAGDKIDTGQMLTNDDLVMLDRKLQISQLYDLGFLYPNFDDSLFTNEDYQRIQRNIGLYYREQGTQNFLDFFGFCLNLILQMKPQWTTNYVDFEDEGSPHIDKPFWEGGLWYPTTHVRFVLDLQTQGQINPSRFQEFFYYIAPINLVLRSTVYQAKAEMKLNLAMAGRMRIKYITSILSLDTVKIQLAGRIHVAGSSMSKGKIPTEGATSVPRQVTL